MNQFIQWLMQLAQMSPQPPQQSLNQWVNGQGPNPGGVYTYNNLPVPTRGAVIGDANVEPRGPHQGLPRPFETATSAHQPAWGINKFNSGAPYNASPNSGDLMRSNTNYPHVPSGEALRILQMMPLLYGGQPNVMPDPRKIAGGGIVGSP